MNEWFDLNETADFTLKFTLAYCAYCLAAYLRRLSRQPTTIVHTSAVNTGSNTCAAVPVTLISPTTGPAAVVATPVRQPRMENQESPIECGHCGGNIKSNPVTTQITDHVAEIIYECEHCQSLVRLPV